MLPNQIGRYQILELLGRGGMGTVYRALDPQLGREVAIKLITWPNLAHDDERRRRFRREVQAAARLNHPHIVTVYDVDLEHEPPYVVLELLSGGTLKDRLKRGPLPWREALDLLRPLAEGLAYAHGAGLVHRDVKPANVMFAGERPGTPANPKANSRLKLVDFGLSYWPDGEALTQTGAVMGTPAYISPEQARGEAVDGRADIFAWGVILFEAIVGHNPLDKGSHFSTLAEVGSDNQIDLSPLQAKVPALVLDLIKRAVAKNREERYPDGAALLTDLTHCLQHAVEASPAQSSSQPEHEPQIQLAAHLHLTPDLEAVLQAMFSRFSRIAIEAEFGRGFSGSRAFRVRLIEAGGRAHLPAVVKLAPAGMIQTEWQAYQTWVEYTLPNIARLEAPPILAENSQWAGLRYALVGSGTFAVQSLHDYYQKATAEDVCWVLENRLFRIMGPNWWLDNRVSRAFQMQMDYDIMLPVNLLIKPAPASPGAYTYIIGPGSTPAPAAIAIEDQVQLKEMAITEVDIKRRQLTLNLPTAVEGRPGTSYRLRLDEVEDINRYRVGQRIKSLTGIVTATRHSLLVEHVKQAVGDEIDLSAERLALPTSAPALFLPNPLLLYHDLLWDFLTVKLSTVHGDLNLENILVDPATRDVSLIDFATVHHGHVLHDLLRLETELLLKLMPPTLVEANLPLAVLYTFYQQLHRATLQPDQPISFHLPHVALEKPFKVLLAIRKMARHCLFEAADWREYYQGLILYLLGALKFPNLRAEPTAPLPGQIAFWVAAIVQHLLEIPLSQEQFPEQNFEMPRDPKAKPKPKPEPVPELEPPYGTMRPDSKFYVERQADDRCRQLLGMSYPVTLFIQAPRQMGKSSLMRRMIAQAGQTQPKRTIFVDFQKFPEQYFNEEQNFLIEFCLMIGDSLKIPDAIDQYWQGRRTNIVKCSRYLTDYIIPNINAPFILALDEVESLFNSNFRANFFGMLRTWHNERVSDPNMARMTLFLSSSTEPYLFIDNPNQSPFNVAEVIALQDFTRPEVEELNQRHASPLSVKQLDELMALIGGHPFLTRLALYLLATGQMDFPALLARATEDNGPFGDHLRNYLLKVLQQPELKQALTQICRNHTYEEDRIFYRLKGAGLIKREGQQIVLRNKLYARYFEERLL